jgi:hypothetical protein
MLANRVIGELVDIVLPEGLLIPGRAADGIAGPIGFPQRVYPDPLFFWRALHA